MAGPKARLLAWLEPRAPKVHRFLTRADRPFPLVREVLAIALVLLVLGALLWGLTGQRLGDAPVVVIESGSMMHCGNGVGHYQVSCTSQRYGRLATIDPGDLVFVRDVDSRKDVTTFAGDGRNRYGEPGDVIVFQKNGQAGTPIIHRAMFWIDVNADGTYTALGQTVSRPQDLQFDRRAFRAVPDCQIRLPHAVANNPTMSGFVTKGDNNVCFDQNDALGGALPVQPAWILGKARGEVPWIGLIKLKVSDITSGTDNYNEAPRDVKTMLFVSVILLVGAPFAIEFGVRWWKRRQGQQAEEAEREERASSRRERRQ